MQEGSGVHYDMKNSESEFTSGHAMGTAIVPINEGKKRLASKERDFGFPLSVEGVKPIMYMRQAKAWAEDEDRLVKDVMQPAVDEMLKAMGTR